MAWTSFSCGWYIIPITPLLKIFFVRLILSAENMVVPGTRAGVGSNSALGTGLVPALALALMVVALPRISDRGWRHT